MKRLLWGLAVLAVAAAAGLAAAQWYLDSRGISTRRLSAYIEQRQQGHNGVIAAAAGVLQAALRATEKTAPEAPDLRGWPVGAAAAPAPAAVAGAAIRAVSDTAQLRAALAQAQPGDVIALQPGEYRIDGGPLAVDRPGTAAAPISVRGSEGVHLSANVVETFVVAAPYWRFENLRISGICPQAGDCEHAFHVVGQGHHFVAVGNTVLDFNAHFKINGSGGRFPDDGTIAYNTLRNDSVRATDHPVTPIDLVGASNWVIKNNLISDFIKQGGDQTSYGAYAKGGGSGTLFERNVVWCELKLRGEPGYRVGLSFGGGGTGPQYCREGRCIVEQSGGIMRANLVAACSDDGIYLNNAAQSRVLGNWVLGSGGVSARFAGSSADIEENLIDGPVRPRDGALIREKANRGGSVPPWEQAPPRRQ
jgi:hypothetical protein